MAVLMVTYDLKKPGRNYAPVHDFLKKFAYCKYLESVWLLDTKWTTQQVRDALNKLIDENDVTFVVRLSNDWASHSYGCASWLNSASRDW